MAKELVTRLNFKSLSSVSLKYADMRLSEFNYVETIDQCYMCVLYTMKDLYCALYYDNYIILETNTDLLEIAYMVNRKINKIDMEKILKIRALYFEELNYKNKSRLAEEAIDLAKAFVKDNLDKDNILDQDYKIELMTRKGRVKW